MTSNEQKTTALPDETVSAKSGNWNPAPGDWNPALRQAQGPVATLAQCPM